MDYEKAYNDAMARLELVVRTGMKLDPVYVFPELAESEDERMQKGLIQHLKELRDWEGGTMPPIKLSSHYDAWIAYLEKQKEQKPITESKRLANEVIEYLTRCGYSPVLKDDSKKEHFHIDIPRHEDDFWQSEEYKHCRSVLGEYYMEGDYGGDTYTLYIWREKKEQKPAERFAEAREKYQVEWSDEVETNLDRAINIIEDAKGVLSDYQTDDGIYECERAVAVLREIAKNGYAVTWNDKDKQNIEKLIEILPQCIFRRPHIIDRDECRDLISWLKSLRPQKLDASKLENFDPVDVLNRIKTEWPMAWEKVVGKQEWSEEDEKILDSLTRLYSKEYSAKAWPWANGAFTYGDVVNFLKSLRPSWKPSEEQMEALYTMVCECRPADQQLLQDIYYGLRKL